MNRKIDLKGGVDRRNVLAGAVGMAAATQIPSPAGGATAVALTAPVPALISVFTAQVTLLPPVEYGVSEGVKRRLIPISGGVFEGPGIRGTVLAGGGDWQDVAEDGFAHIFARYSLRTDDGVVIGVSNPGIRRGPMHVLQSLAAGEAVDPSQYYFRTAPTFTVEDGKYDWLRKSLFVCAGVRRASDVEIAFYAVT